MRRAAAVLALTLTIVASAADPADAVIQTTLPQLLFTPTNPPPAPTPAPIPPPINPGYAATPQNGLSPILTEPNPLFGPPQPPSLTYPPPQLPGPIDQQKMDAYRNALRAQQWQLQPQGLSPDSWRAREIQQQLNAPDPQ
jgi:hypothetical protein